MIRGNIRDTFAVGVNSYILQESEDYAKDMYGALPLNMSQEKKSPAHKSIRSLVDLDAGKEVLFRARLHTIRAKGIGLMHIRSSRWKEYRAGLDSLGILPE